MNIDEDERKGGSVPQGRPPRAEAHRVRQRILNAARAVFLKRGFHQATMDMIVKRARASKRTVYNLFDNKEALFTAVLEDFIQRSFLPIEGILTGLPMTSMAPLRDRLTALARSYRDAASQPEARAMARLLTDQRDTLSRATLMLFEQGYERAVTIVQEMLEDADAIDPPMAARIFSGMTIAIPLQGNLPVDPNREDDIVGMVDFLLRGTKMDTI